MIGKPEWFNRRKYTGWGLTPKNWQGWAYVVAIVLPIIILQAIPGITPEIMAITSIIWLVILFIDVIDIMRKLPMDEREKAHEAIAERNALWMMILVLVVGIAYQAAQSVVFQTNTVDPLLIVALLLATVVKAGTNFYLDKKD